MGRPVAAPSRNGLGRGIIRSNDFPRFLPRKRPPIIKAAVEYQTTAISKTVGPVFSSFFHPFSFSKKTSPVFHWKNYADFVGHFRAVLPVTNALKRCSGNRVTGRWTRRSARIGGESEVGEEEEGEEEARRKRERENRRGERL